MELHRKEIRSLMLSSYMLDGIYARMARKLGMKMNMLTLLYALDDGHPHSQIEISREWMIPKTTLNTIVMECVQKGLVELVPGGHGKEKQILLTTSGQGAASRALGALYEMEEEAYQKTLEAYEPDFSHALTAFCCHLKEEERRFCPETEKEIEEEELR